MGVQWALGSAVQYTSTGSAVTMRWGIGSAFVLQEYVAAGGAGHPTMRRWGGVPYMMPGPVLAGRSW